MVPNEGGALMVNRKLEDHTMSEGKKKKKIRKKQTVVSRPACSWVYFSREFIKEYNASHPESSGLRAATKAASDAWKTMSVEEKAKYTKKSREVWDNYLRTAPASSPKPRKQTKLVTRCSPGRLLNVIQRLTLKQKDAVKSMGFGSLLGLRCRTLRRSLCLWLLERFNTAKLRLEICSQCIPLHPKDVEHVLGLSAIGKEVVNSGPDERVSNLRLSYNATNQGISVKLLEERLAGPEAGEDFKRSFVLYALGTLLSPTARLDVSPSFLHFLTDMDVVHQFNWGKFLLDRLVREISRFRQGKQRAVGGCLLFLQLFYYENVSVGRSVTSPAITMPCLSSWGEEEITEREKKERELGGYGFGKVIWQPSDNGDRSDGLRGHRIGIELEDVPEFDPSDNQPYRSNSPGDTDMGTELNQTACRNEGYGCNERSNFATSKDHEETCIYSPCSCPLLECSFIGSNEQLSLHFSTKHWDSGRRFRYNSPLSISLAANEHFLVLQAEEDGILFLINKGVETIGHMVTITRVGPSSINDTFSYAVTASRRGVSSLRLKSTSESFPGRVEGFPPLDFLLVPFRFLGSSGEVSLDICIWRSAEHGEDFSCS